MDDERDIFKSYVNCNQGDNQIHMEIFCSLFYWYVVAWWPYVPSNENGGCKTM